MRSRTAVAVTAANRRRVDRDVWSCASPRSEERRGGEEGRSRGVPDPLKKKKQGTAAESCVNPQGQLAHFYRSQCCQRSRAGHRYSGASGKPYLLRTERFWGRLSWSGISAD